MAGKNPERSCLGCRKVKAKSDLLRFVLAPDLTVVPDILAKLPGRGAYTCLSLNCLQEALKRNQFSRAFKTPVVVPDQNGFADTVTAKLEERIASYVALANKAGRLMSGSDLVAEAVRKKNVGLVIIAADASAESGRKIAFLASRESIPCYHLLTRDRFGALIGKGLRSAVGIQRGDFTAVLVKEIERFRNFSEEGRTK